MSRSFTEKQRPKLPPRVPGKHCIVRPLFVCVLNVCLCVSCKLCSVDNVLLMSIDSVDTRYWQCGTIATDDENERHFLLSMSEGREEVRFAWVYICVQKVDISI